MISIADTEFEKMCSSGLEISEEKGGNKEFVEIFLNSSTFESFVEMMRDMCRRFV